MEDRTMCVTLAERETIIEAGRPDPVCASCGFAYDIRDGGWLYRDLCDTCQSNAIEGLIVAVVYARGKKATAKALKRIRRLRNLVK
jgi:hypothetical protein